jgi:putative membrane protein
MKRFNLSLRFTTTVLAAAMVFPMASFAAAKPPVKPLPTGKQFVKKAAQINLAEISLGKLAEQKATDPALKDFGALMVRQHTALQQELDRMAKAQKITLPTKPGAKQVALKDQLAKLPGQRFDNAYIKHMLSGHRRAIAMIENEIEYGKNPAYKACAEKALPVIQDHIRVAENLAGKMGRSGKYGLQAPSDAISAGAHPASATEPVVANEHLLLASAH